MPLDQVHAGSTSIPWHGEVRVSRDCIAIASSQNPVSHRRSRSEIGRVLETIDRDPNYDVDSSKPLLDFAETRVPTALTIPPPSRPRKLRKHRSSLTILSQRFASSSDSLAPYSKFRHKIRTSSSTPCLPSQFSQKTETQPTPPLPRPLAPLVLPQGIHQIGSGIGFTYTLPATSSKASLCPPTTPNKGKTGLRTLSLRFTDLKLRAKNSTRWLKKKSSLLMLQDSSRSQQPPAPTSFHHHNGDDSHGSYTEGTTTAFSSPLSATTAPPSTPLTPEAIEIPRTDNLEANRKGPIADTVIRQATLRLVSPPSQLDGLGLYDSIGGFQPAL